MHCIVVLLCCAMAPIGDKQLRGVERCIYMYKYMIHKKILLLNTRKYFVRDCCRSNTGRGLQELFTANMMTGPHHVPQVYIGNIAYIRLPHAANFFGLDQNHTTPLLYNPVVSNLIARAAQLKSSQFWLTRVSLTTHHNKKCPCL